MANLAAARVELQAAQKDLAEKQTHLTNEHPDVKQALRRTANAEAAERRAALAVANWKPSAAGEPVAPVVGLAAPDEGRIAALRRALSAVRSRFRP